MFNVAAKQNLSDDPGGGEELSKKSITFIVYRGFLTTIFVSQVVGYLFFFSININATLRLLINSYHLTRGGYFVKI